MANNPIKDDELTPEEFIKLASEAKIQLIDRLAASMLALGEEYARTAAEYYRQKYTGKEENFERLTYEHKRLEIKYDVLKHAISALQSTLKAEKTL